MDILKIGAVFLGGTIALGMVPGLRAGVSKALADPLGYVRTADNDPFERIILKLRQDHQDFVDSAECRAKLAADREFWASEGVSVDKLLPDICTRKS